MKTYKTPLYPALMARLPGEGRRNVKAAGGYFNVADEDVADFEKFIAARPHYRIVAVEDTTDRGPVGGSTDGETVVPAPDPEMTTADGSEHGIVIQPEPTSESELHPERVSVEMLEQLNVPTLKERLEGLGLATDGRKAVLVKRLADATNTPAGLGDGTTDDADANDTAE